MKRKLMQTIFAMTLLALGGVAARATAPSPFPIFTNAPLARGTDVSDGTIPLQVGTDIAMAQITVLPGGHSGWHSHPGGAIIVVAQGSRTVFGSKGGAECEVTTYGAGQAFIERPGEVDQVLTPAQHRIPLRDFPRLAQGESPRTDEPDPAHARWCEDLTNRRAECRCAFSIVRDIVAGTIVLSWSVVP